jgi:hypothetical protein
MRAENNTDSGTGGCLLSGVNSLSGSEPPSFEEGEPAWEASTLPLSYTRQSNLSVILRQKE